MANENNLLNEEGTPKSNEGGEQLTAEQIAAQASENSQESSKTPEDKEIEFTDEQVVALYNKKFNTQYKSIDEIKLPVPEKTEEEKQKELSAKEQKMLSLHLTNGGRVEDFVSLKSLANADPKELSIKKVLAEYKAMGFTDQEAQEELKKRYYQFSEEELAEMEESEQKVILAKKEKFTEKLYGKAAYDIQNSQKYLQSLEDKLNEDAYEAEIDAKLEAQADSIAKTFERKRIVELGEFNGIQLPPVEHTISEEDLSDVINTVRNKQTREQLLYNEDGTEKVDLLIELLVLKKTFNAAIKNAEQLGNNRAIAHFETIAPKNPKDLSIGSNRANASAGGIGKAIAAKVVKN